MCASQDEDRKGARRWFQCGKGGGSKVKAVVGQEEVLAKGK